MVPGFLEGVGTYTPRAATPTSRWSHVASCLSFSPVQVFAVVKDGSITGIFRGFATEGKDCACAGGSQTSPDVC